MGAPITLLVLAVMATCGVMAFRWWGRSALNPQPQPTSLEGVMRLPASQLARIPITRLNLLCAEGLPSAGQLEIEEFQTVIQSWARHVRSETDRHLYRFQRNPQEFENSAGFFRMVMLAVVLAEDYGIRYNEQRKLDLSNPHPGDGFFAKPKDVFLHGLLGPDRQGTCSSLPVLYVAIGRELGYPLRLVTTKAHLFVRWEGNGERFNIEAAGNGVNRFPDDYYRHWPMEVSAEEAAAEGYLKSLTPPEELAVFLAIRGMCWKEAGRDAEAGESFHAASRLVPDCRAYAEMARAGGRPVVAAQNKPSRN